MRKRYIVLVIIVIATMFSSCRSIRPYEMLRNSKDYEVSQQEPSEIEYRIQPNDRLNIRVLNNNGQAYFGFGGGTTGGTSNFNTTNNQSGGGFPVEFDGKVKLPVLGRIDISGKTIREAEDTLEML